MIGPEDKASRRRWLIIIILLSLVLRLAASLSVPEGIHWKDGLEYDSFAASLQKEHAYLNQWGNPSAYRPPGYPVLILLCGRNSTAVRIVQSILGALTSLLVYLAGRKITGEKAALLAAALTAIYPLYIYTAVTYYPAVLLTFLLSAVFLLITEGGRENSLKKIFAAGVLAGLMTLTKGSFLLPILLAAVWLAAERRGGESNRGKVSLRLRLRDAVVFILPVLIIIGLWGLRNYRVLGSFRPLSTNSGYNFWLGSYPGVEADTGNRKLPGQRDEEFSIRRSHHEETELDRAFLRKGLEHVREDPGRFAVLAISKAVNFWRFYPSPMTRELKFWEKAVSAFSYGGVLIFGLFFLLAKLRASREARLILLIFIGYTIIHALFISKVRLRLPLDILLIICAGGGLREVAGMLGINLLK